MKKQKQKGSVFFAMLTEDEQTKFASEAINQGKDMTKLLNGDYINFLHFTGDCFKFEESAEGPEYWVELSSSGRDGIDGKTAFLSILGYESEEELVMDKMADVISDVIADVVKDLIKNKKGYKTGRKLFNELTTEQMKSFKTEFIAQRGNGEFGLFMKIKFKDMADMLSSAFSFKDSKDGIGYWSDMIEEYLEENSDLNKTLKDLNIDTE